GGRSGAGGRGRSADGRDSPRREPAPSRAGGVNVKGDRKESPGEGKLLPDGTMLGVWAHPDDETYLAAGLMAEAVQRGERVLCVTATRGEEGSWDEERWPTSEMGKVREAEMMASLEVLGVTEHHWLDYYDGTCADVPFDEVLGRGRGVLEA